jgi:S-adenosylmethionine decarboxylase
MLYDFTTDGGADAVMKTLGRHILAEVFGCEPSLLNEPQAVERIMVRAALEAGAEVREVAFHQFSPQGVSGVVVISESHLAIHTWPELGYAAVDVFTCGDRVDPWEACRYIVSQFGASQVSASEVKRGVFHEEKQAVVG